ncbi:MAG: hypothetical protein ACRC3H_16140 [Lachnospiraceae bacterium]
MGDNNRKEVEDELDKIQIEQLHKATLNFSNQSLETKKLCTTVELAALTLFAGLYNIEMDSTVKFIEIMPIIGVAIPLLFYFVDVFLYYYQDSLRARMIKEENKIRSRHKINLKNEKKDERRLLRAFFNGSQIIYLGLILISIIITIIVFMRG